MAGGEDKSRELAALTEEQAARMLDGMNEVIRAGEEARRLRAEMITVLAGLGWTQDRIAGLTGMSQPAVSKQVAKGRDGEDAASRMALSLDQHDAPWLEGRLWALAEDISERCGEDARCARHVDALARGRKRFTPAAVDELRRLVEEDLRLHRDVLPGGHRTVYDRIGRGLDVPSRTTAAPTASASVRRTLAHRIQLDRLGGGGAARAAGGQASAASSPSRLSMNELTENTARPGPAGP